MLHPISLCRPLLLTRKRRLRCTIPRIDSWLVYRDRGPEVGRGARSILDAELQRYPLSYRSRICSTRSHRITTRRRVAARCSNGLTASAGPCSVRSIACSGGLKVGTRKPQQPATAGWDPRAEAVRRGKSIDAVAPRWRTSGAQHPDLRLCSSMFAPHTRVGIVARVPLSTEHALFQFTTRPHPRLR